MRSRIVPVATRLAGMALALFDLDNTLVDRTVAFGRAVPRLAERYGLDLTVAVPFIIEADGDGMVGWETWMAQTIDRFDVATTVDEMRAAFNDRYLSGYELEPEVADGLHRLRSAGWRIGVVTNGPPSQSDKITRTGLDRLVHGWAVSEEVGVRKPDRHIFEVAAERCGSVLDGGWMVGDSPPADMAGARNAGLTSVWLHRGRTWTSAAAADDHELANGQARTTPTEPFGPDHQADGPVAAIELILSTT